MARYWYIGSPYSRYPGGREAAHEAVVDARGLLINAGVPCFSPIIHSHWVAVLCGIDPDEHSIWLPVERPMLDAARGLIVLTLNGWEESHGLSEERRLFRAAGKPEVRMIPGVVPEEVLPTIDPSWVDEIAAARGSGRTTPVHWGGLDADGEARARNVWDHAASDAAYHAQRLLRIGADPAIVRRLLEPFL